MNAKRNVGREVRKRHLLLAIFHLSLNSPMKSYCSIIHTVVYQEINAAEPSGSASRPSDSFPCQIPDS
jgi:hypothetical protein